MITALLFIASLVLVVVASELFTNAIEWAGYLLNLGTGATGSLLAALGTSLPETVVPIVALATHSTGANLVATGAVLGSPFLLAHARRRRHRYRRPDSRWSAPARDRSVARRAATWASSSARSRSRCSRACCRAVPRIAVGALLLLTYAVYVVATLRGSAAAGERPEPLHIVRWRPGEPHPVLVTVQLLIAVGLLVLGSQLFVTALDQTRRRRCRFPSSCSRWSSCPVATELPETLNSVLWVRTNDDMLAFGNVAGSATFQSCVLAAIGIVFTTWQPGSAGLISATLTRAHRRLPAGAALARPGPRRVAAARRSCRGLVYVVAQVATGGRLAL